MFLGRKLRWRPSPAGDFPINAGINPNTPNGPSALFARAMPALFVLLWATGFIGAKLGLPHAPPLKFLLWRFAMVIVLMTLLAWAFDGNHDARWRQMLPGSKGFGQALRPAGTFICTVPNANSWVGMRYRYIEAPPMEKFPAKLLPDGTSGDFVPLARSAHEPP